MATALPSNLRSNWVFTAFLAAMENKYPDFSGVVEEHKVRLDAGFDNKAVVTALVEFLWSRAQGLLAKERNPGWHRRVLGAHPSLKANAMIIAWEMRNDVSELWKRGEAQKSSRLICASEALRAISLFTLATADGLPRPRQQALQETVDAFPDLDYEVALIFPNWNTYAAQVKAQELRQERVFKNSSVPMDDEE